jgi:TatD DNase family protein
VLALLKTYAKKGLTGVIHCFTGTKDEAREFLDVGFYISFSGIVTFKNALNVQEAAQMVPSDRILIETDSPYLAPVPCRGQSNEPSFLPHTARFLSHLRGEDENYFILSTYKNATNLFKELID